MESVKLVPHNRRSAWLWKLYVSTLLPNSIEDVDESAAFIINRIEREELTCLLIQSMEDERLFGFLITNYLNPVPGVTYLNIYVCGIPPSSPRWVLPEAEKALVERIKLIEELGGPVVNAITFHTLRDRGFARRMGPLGYQKKLVQFMKRLDTEEVSNNGTERIS